MNPKDYDPQRGGYIDPENEPDVIQWQPRSSASGNTTARYTGDADEEVYDAAAYNPYPDGQYTTPQYENSALSDADPSLDYNDMLDDDYSAVIKDIAASRKQQVYGTDMSEDEQEAYSQYRAPQLHDRSSDFQVRIDDESLRALDRQQEQYPMLPQPQPEPSPAQPPMKRARRMKKRRRFRLLKALLLVAFVIGVSLYLSNVILNAVYDVFGLQKEDIDIEVDIPMGSSVVDIAGTLEEKGVISEPLIFRVYSRIKGADDLYQYGTYTLNQKMSYDEIIKLLKVRVPRKDVVNVTIPEGLTSVEIADKLEEAGVCDRDKFLELVRTGDIDHPLVKNIGGGKYRYFRLEGYLFPDTYQFYMGESESSALRRFLDRFQEILTNEVGIAMQDTTYTLDQLLTLASVIQRESSHVEGMDMVSSVFHNRLNNPGVFPQLQSDPTISYVTDNILPELDVKDDGYYAAYSTYICTGLPVGPISNPGLAAIRAAIYPADSTYYFFVTDRAGNFYFAETDAEHEVNKQKAGLS